MKSIVVLGLAVVVTTILGCGDDDGSATDAGMVATDAGGTASDAGNVAHDAGMVATDAGGGGSDDGGTVDPRVMRVCTAAVAAGCSMGPPTQANCESGLGMYLASACMAEVSAYLTCADGMAVVCDAMGYTQSAGCPTEQAAFSSCIAGL